eukprot:403342226
MIHEFMPITTSVYLVILAVEFLMLCALLLFKIDIAKESHLRSSISQETTADSGNVALDGDKMVSYYYQFECWTLPHVLMVIIIVVFMIVSIGLLTTLSTMLNDTRAHSHLPWASSQSNLILAYLVLHLRNKHFYFPNKKVYIATIIQEASIFWLALSTLIINQILLQLSISCFVYLILSMLAFDAVVLIHFIKKDNLSVLADFPNLTTAEQFENYFLQIKKYFLEIDYKHIDKILMFGLIKHHQTDCHDQNCVCEYLYHLMSQNRLESYLEQFDDKALIQMNIIIQDEQQIKAVDGFERQLSNMDMQKNENKNDPKQAKKFEHKFKMMLFRFYFVMLNKCQAKHPNNIRLKFLQVACLKDELNNEFKSLFQIFKTIQEKPPIEWQFFLYQAMQRVERIMYNKYLNLKSNKNGLDILKVNEFEDMFIKFERQVINTANNCLSFWKELMENRESCDVNRIHDFGVQIANRYHEVSSLAHQMIEMYPNHLMLLKIYAYFLADVMNNEEEAFEIHSKAKSFLSNQQNLQNKEQDNANNHDENKFFSYNSKTVLITMTVTPKDIGNIVNANFETKQLLGYKNKEIKGKNVRILMPKILSDNHDSFIHNYFETAKAKILEVRRVVIAKDKQGFVVPVHILVKAIPNLKRNLTFVGFLKKVDDKDQFMQPPSIFAGQDYHIIIGDQEGQIHGFTRNCWETFGFKPQFFFNRFGDPEQQIRIEKIIKNLRNPFFVTKIEQKKEGQYCSLDTGQIMETISKELLSREEQEVLKTISGSYNINLQINEMKFADGKICLKIYKVLKVSRIIRSQNVLDMISIKVDEINECSDASIDFDDSTNSQPEAQNPFQRRLDSIDMEDEINQSVENSNDLSDRSITSTLHIQDNQTSKYLQSFKKSISNNKMPRSIINLNRLVIVFVLLLLAISIADMVISIRFYNFTKDNQKNMQQLFQKQNLISQITSNMIWLTLLNMKVIPGQYRNFSGGQEGMINQIISDYELLDQIENSMQGQSYKYFIYHLKNYQPNTILNVKFMNQDSSLQQETQSMRYMISQYISKTQQFMRNISDLQMTPEIYKIGNQSKISKPNFRTLAQKDIYYIVQNTLDTLSDINNQQNRIFKDDLMSSVDINRILIIILFVCCTVFVILSGIVVFPIVIGVQKNKVMILSIYFELPLQEIQKSFRKCLYFMAKVESKLDDKNESSDDAFYAKKLIEIEERQQQDQIKQQVPDERALEVHVTSFHRQPNAQNIPDIISELSESSSSQPSERSTTRGMLGRGQRLQGLDEIDMEDIPINLAPKAPGISKKKSIVINFRHPSVIATKNQVRFSQSGKNQYRKTFNQSILNDSSQLDPNSISIDVNEEENSQNPMHGMDKNKMFKDIKVKNSKINLITLLVIFLFISYFATSFIVNNKFITEIHESIDYQYELYQEKHSIQYAFLYFIAQVMKNQTIYEPYENNASNYKQSYFQGYIQNIQNIQPLKDKLKKFNKTGVLQGPAITYLEGIEKDDFCNQVSPYLDNDYYKEQCKYIGDGTFKLGLKHTINSIIYQFQQLQINFDQLRLQPNTSYTLEKLLSNPYLIEFQIISNIYLYATFKGMLQKFMQSIEIYYEKVLLFVELKLAFFVVFTLLMLSVVWRVFLKSIQSEIFRSKGMLNMIPTEFLEKQQNLKNLSLNKLIDVQ